MAPALLSAAALAPLLAWTTGLRPADCFPDLEVFLLRFRFRLRRRQLFWAGLHGHGLRLRLVGNLIFRNDRRVSACKRTACAAFLRAPAAQRLLLHRIPGHGHRLELHPALPGNATGTGLVQPGRVPALVGLRAAGHPPLWAW